MKASPALTGCILAFLSFLALLIPVLRENVLITTAAAGAIGTIINFTIQYFQQAKPVEPPAAASRSLAPDGTVSATPSLWKRVLLG